MKSLVLLAACGCVLLIDAPASGEDRPEVDCDNAQVQMEMTYCAEQGFIAADKLLNAQYKKTRDLMRGRDADADPSTTGAEKALVAAQRAWVTYRDAQCASYGFQARGGSMEPMLIYGCQADLTAKRTEELKELTVEGN